MPLKILLFFPNTSNEGVVPLAIASLSAIAKAKGCEVKYFETSFYRMTDSAYSERKQTGEFKLYEGDVFEILPHEQLQSDFNRLLEEYRPDILAVHANSLEYELFNEIMDKTKSVSHKPFVILGGCHATVDPEGSIDNPFVDIICVGEGEKAWAQFLSHYLEGNSVNNISNLWVKTDTGIVKNPLSTLMSQEELWNQELDFSFFDIRHFHYVFDGTLYKRGNLELSRGCPYDCTYCVGLGKYMRVREFENVKKATQKLVDNYSIEMIQFQDESFLSIPDKVLEQFCKWYGNEVRLPLMIQVRPESIKETKVKLLADMGIPIQVSFGIESGSERVLREICNRRMKIDKIKSGLKILKDYQLRTTAYTMIGFPTETREEVFQTINLVRSLDLDVAIMSVFFPFEGTPLRTLCIEKGFITGNESARSFTAGSILKNQPMSKEEIDGIRRCFALYTKLPLEYYPQIERCEKDIENNREVFKNLVEELNTTYYQSWGI
jgi:anaerobic magnesium-protoporphyrin IX monomethyl ester cyclase